jgi:acyl-CoA hydrolase
VLDLRPHIRPGDGVWWGQAGAEAIPLVDALVDQVVEIGPVHAFCGLTVNPRLRDLPAQLSVTSYGALGELRALARSGLLTIVPAHYSVLPRLFAERLVPGDVGLVQVAPPAADGLCSLGIGADFAADAIPYSRVLIGEINHRMPTGAGGPAIPFSRLAATVETDRPLAGLVEREPDSVDGAIGARVAALVDDGDTVQVGVGSLPAAIVDGLADHRDLGFHSGMLTDSVLRLIEKGVVTGSRKPIDAGLAVAGTAIGSTAFYAGLGERLVDTAVSFRPASYTHAPAVLARLGNLVAVNSALEIDLTGHVGSEIAGGRYLGAIGGQADFSGAAARTGSLSIIALRSTAGGASTIRPVLQGPVTTARADVDVVVTEHGTAWLRGCPLSERPARLAAVAAPEHRDDLLRTWKETEGR